MGIYTEYIERRLSVPQLEELRKAQLRRIAKRRNSDVLVYGAAARHKEAAINYGDLQLINDQLSNLKGSDHLDVILETPGGSGETVEDIVRLIRGRYKRLGVIVPGMAKSAGTIFAMAADEIVMEPASALGPIDAQIGYQGKAFSAHALLDHFKTIKDEVAATNTLNKAYVPILQQLSLGELQHAQNAYDFAWNLVSDWLVNFKFKEWHTHSSTGQPVTPESRRKRAEQIADALRDHRRWKTHSRSIKIEDLRAMKLQITDFSADQELCDAIRRYHVLLSMTFESAIFKMVETATSHIYRMEKAQAILPANVQPERAVAEMACNRCGERLKVEAAFTKDAPASPGMIPFPADNRLACPKCGNVSVIDRARRDLEAQAGRKIQTPVQRP